MSIEEAVTRFIAKVTDTHLPFGGYQSQVTDGAALVTFQIRGKVTFHLDALHRTLGKLGMPHGYEARCLTSVMYFEDELVVAISCLITPIRNDKKPTND